MERDPFLSESWERLKEEEQGREPQEMRDVGIFEDLETLSERNESIKEYLEDIKNQIIYYVRTIAEMEHLQNNSAAREDIAQIDSTRRIAHDSLITKIDILSRICAKNGLDNNWRDMIGIGREQVTRWAINVAESLTEDIVKE